MKLPDAPWRADGTRVYAADGGEIAVATKADPRWRHSAQDTAQAIAMLPALVSGVEELAQAIRDELGDGLLRDAWMRSKILDLAAIVAENRKEA